jgi:transferase CAF17, mitochondrial
MTHTSDLSRPNPRPRGTGKLLSSVRGVGLALLRLEHVEGLHQGLLKLTAEKGTEEVSKKIWSISPWWPVWWPKRPLDQESNE